MLYKAYQNKASIEQNKHAEKYYYFVKEKKIVGMKKENYTESVPYSVREEYIEKVQYTEKEFGICWGMDHNGRYIQHLSRIDLRTWPITNEHIVIGEHVFGPFEAPETWQKRAIGYSWFEFTKYVDVPKTRDETRYKDVIKWQNVTKQRDIPDLQDVEVKKYNEQKYNGDINNVNNTISQTRSQIIELLKDLKSANVQMKSSHSLELINKLEKHAQIESKEAKINYDSLKNMFKDLYEEWKYLEFEAMILKLQASVPEQKISSHIQELEISNLHEDNFLGNSDNNFISSILGYNEEHHIDFN